MSHYRTIQALGTPIVINSGVTKMLGSLNASALLGHIMYWSDRTDNPLGFYRTLDSLCDETGLSKDELKTARKILVDKGIVTEEYKRLEHKLYFKFNNTVFDEQFEAYLATLEKPISRNGDFHFGEYQNPTFGEGEIPLSLVNKITTKITSESESENSHTQNPKNQNQENPNLENLSQEKKLSDQENYSAEFQPDLEILTTKLIMAGVIGENQKQVNERNFGFEIYKFNDKYSHLLESDRQKYTRLIAWFNNLKRDGRIGEYFAENQVTQPTAEAPVTQYKSVSPFARLMGNV